MPSNNHICIDLCYTHIKEKIIRNLKSIKIYSFILALLSLSYTSQHLQAAAALEDPISSPGAAAGGAGTGAGAYVALPDAGKTIAIGSSPSRSIDEYAALCRASFQGKKPELTTLYELADKGDFRAQACLAIVLNFNSLTLAKRYLEEAHKYIRLCLPELKRNIETRDAFSQWALGYMCINMSIPEADITAGKAIDLIKESVAQRCDIAIASLGGLYISGKGVPKDERKALELISPSALRGIANSQWALGYIYATSKDLSNPEEALKWYRESAKEGWHHAQYHLGFYCQSRNMLPEAFVNLKASADQGNIFALNDLGAMYTKGNAVVNQDYKAAFPLFFQSATEGHHALAERNLGWLYAEGLGVDANPKESVRWYMKAADHGDGESQYIIGLKFKQHYHAQPTNADLRAKAHDYLSRAAKQGHEKANLELINLDRIPAPTGGTASSASSTSGSCIIM